eukprot:XP_001709190.1 Hypothetical protein GL50803_32800 [Giardia lamblia ATCC 50803]
MRTTDMLSARASASRRHARVARAHIASVTIAAPLAVLCIKLTLTVSITNKDFTGLAYHSETVSWVTPGLNILKVLIAGTRDSVLGVVETVTTASAYQSVVTSASFNNTISLRAHHVTWTKVVDRFLTVESAVPERADALLSNAHSVAGTLKVCAWLNAGL